MLMKEETPMYNKRYRILIIVTLIALALGACAQRANGPKAVTLTDGSRGEAASLAPAQPAGMAPGDTAKGIGGGERMIVRTAQMSLVVKDAEASLGQVKAIVQELEGYVVDSRMWRQDDQLRGTVTVRVPSESLDEALSRFKSLAVKVESESGGSQDVTEEYSDLNAQLRNLEATEKELLELLKTVREKTGKAEDILAVHRELTSIRGQIEQLKGRMQYLERTADMAAVSIELIPDVLAKPISKAGWRPGEALSGALRALLGTLQFLVEAAIWIVIYLLPVVVILVIPVGIIVYLWRRRRGSRSTHKGAGEEKS
jgi:hypothetical protein